MHAKPRPETEEDRLRSLFGERVKEYSAIVARLTDYGRALPEVEWEVLRRQVERAYQSCEDIRRELLQLRAAREGIANSCED